MTGRNLDAALVVKTLERLHARVGERFPEAGITTVCADLVKVSRTTARRARRNARPQLLIRTVVLLILAGVAALGVELWLLGLIPRTLTLQADPVTLAQGLESSVNLLILAGAAVWFLLGWEERAKRARALADLHELRSFAHVIDMHQLTKDPTLILGRSGQATPSSPKREMSRFELTRYLDYCAEMLSLIGKLAALYAEHTHDARVVEAVNDVENLTTDLGRKIWQKITILSALDETAA